MTENFDKNISNNIEYIPLSEAGKILNTSRDYMNVLVRRGKLRAIKLGRNWVTTSEWLSEYQKSVGRGVTQHTIDNEVSSRIEKIKHEEKAELENLKIKLVLENEVVERLKKIESQVESLKNPPPKADPSLAGKISRFRDLEISKFRNYALSQEIPLSSRELKATEKEIILEAVSENIKSRDVSEFAKASRHFGILRNLKHWSNFKFFTASALVVVLLVFSLAAAFFGALIPGIKDFSISGIGARKFQASIVYDIFKEFPKDVPNFSNWLTSNFTKPLTFFKAVNIKELTIGPLQTGTSKIVKAPEFPQINTLTQAEALDALVSEEASKIAEGVIPGIGVSTGEFTLIENRLSIVEAGLKDQTDLTNTELHLQKKTILGTLETLIGISKLLPIHPISTIVIQGQPATLTTYSIAPQIQTGFDRLSASYLTLSNNAVINGSLTVRSGGTFNTLSVSGDTGLTGNTTIGGTLSVAGDTTLSNLTLSGTLNAPSSQFNLNSASSTYLTVSNTGWINQLKVTGTATTTFNNPITSASGNFIIAGDSANNILLNPYGGKVGVGTTSPNNLLTLAGATTPALGFTTNTGLSGWTMGIDTTDSNKFKIASSTAVGTNTRLTIDGNGNVGVGTTSPGSLLSVHSLGNVYFGGALTVSGTVNFQNSTTFSSGFTLSGIFTQTASSTSSIISSVASSTATHYIFDARGAGPIFNILKNNSSKFYIDNLGNVGIATTTVPSGFGFNVATSTFVYGNQFISGGLGVGLATTTNGVLQTSSDASIGGNFYVSGNSIVAGNSTTIGASSANTLTINSSITSNLIPDANATRDLGSTARYWNNAFINTLTANNISAASTSIGGTQSKTFTIDSGNASADQETQTLIFFRGTVVPNALLTWNAATTSKRFEFNQTLYINNGSASTTNPSLTVQTIANQTANGLQVIDNNSSNIFSVSPVGNNTTMVNASTTNLTVSGNLWAPANSTSTFGGVLLLADGSATAPSLAFTNDTDTGLYRIDANRMSFVTNAADRLTIDSSGNIGIGTTSPNNLLTLYKSQAAGTISSIYNPNASGYTSVILGTDSISASSSISFYNSSYVSVDLRSALELRTGGTGNILMRSGGNVGVGTAITSPQATIDVGTNDAFTSTIVDEAIIRHNTTGTAANGLGAGLAFWGQDVTGANQQLGRIAGEVETASTTLGFGSRISFWTKSLTNLSEKMRLTSTGALGLATTTFPIGYGFNVATNTQIFGKLSVGTGTLQLMSGNIISDSGQFNITNQANTALTFSTNNLERMRIDNSGNVGIGTTSPITTFAVNGSGYFGNALGVGILNTTANTFRVGQCVTGDTRLRRRRRRKTKNNPHLISPLSRGSAEGVEDDEYIYDEPMIVNIKPGDEILSLNEKTGELVWRQVKQLAYMGIKPIYKLTTASGKTIRTTGNHPYFVKSFSFVNFVSKFNIRNIKNFFFPEKLYTQFPHAKTMRRGTHIGERFSKLHRIFGLKEILQFLFYSFSQFRVKSFQFAFRSIYQSVFPTHNYAGYVLTRPALMSLSAFSYSRLMPFLYSSLNGQRSSSVSINFPSETDSYSLSESFSNNRSSILHTNSQNANKSKRNHAGLPSRFMPATAPNLSGSPAPLGAIREKCSIFSRVAGTSNVDFENLLAIQKNSTKVKECLSNTDTPVAKNGYWMKVEHLKEGMEIAVAKETNKSAWDKIISIEYLPEEKVYDIEIEDTHNFVANGIIAHNTAFIVDGTGNVGIGTTTPNNLLSISSATTPALGFTTATGFGWTVGMDTADSNKFKIASSTAVGTNARLTIDGNGNVGIGTTSPSALLNIASTQNSLTALRIDSGSIGFNGVANISGFNAGATLISMRSATDISVIEQQSSRTAVDGNIVSEIRGIAGNITLSQIQTVFSGAGGNSGHLLFSTTNAGSNLERMRITTAGNVGIGTTTPNNLLTLSAATTPALGFTTATGFGWTVGMDTADSNKFKIASSTAVGTNARLTIDGNGNVIVGTTTASAAATGGDIVVKNNNSIRSFNSAGVTAYQLIRWNTGDNVLIAGDNVAPIGIGSIPTAVGAAGGELVMQNNFAIRSVNAAGSNTYSLIQGTLSNAIALMGGNVGIGTTSPGTLSTSGDRVLTIETTTGNRAGVLELVGKDTSAGVYNPMGIVQFGQNISGTYATLARIIAQRPAGGATNEAELIFYTSAAGSLTQKVVFDKGGNVGIGTTTPNNLLSISSATTPALGFTTATGFGWTVGMDTADSNKFKIASSTAVGTNARLTIDGNGNVGIGTSNPTNIFQVSGSNAIGEIIGISGNPEWRVTQGGNSVRMAMVGSTGTRIGTIQATDLSFDVNNSIKMTLQATSGNVGIGTTTPNNLLSISSATTPAVGFTTATGFGWTVGMDTADSNKFKIASSTAVGTNTRLTIDSTGNVGIGTTNPTALLDVRGTVVFGATLNTRNFFDVGGEGSHAFTSGATLTTPTNYVSIRPSSVAPTSGTGDMSILRAGTGSLNPTGASTLGATAIFDAPAKGGAGTFTNMATVYISGAPTGGTNNAALVVNSGNVGIGTAGPTGKLTISLDATIKNDYISLIDTAASGKTFTLYNRLSGIAGLFSIYDTTAAVSRLVIDTSGNVGIGTTSPSSIWTPTLQMSGTFGGIALTATSAGGGTFSIGSNVQGGTRRLSFYDETAAAYRMTLDSAGNVGIGTTSPTQVLSVQGNILTSGCLKVKGAADTGTCVDLAESYPVSESVEAGDIVMLDQASPVHIKKATATNNLLVGIVSTNPSILLNGDSTLFGGSTPLPFASSTAPVALAGRVPVKVSLEGGPIKIGDRIALSSVPGVGMAATTSGMTVGIALEPYDPSTSSGQVGKILVFVNLGLYAKLDAKQGSVDLISLNNDLNLNGFSLLNVKSISGLNNLWSIDADGNITAKSISTQALTVGGGNTSGITVYDRGTTQPKCVYVENDVIKISTGVCGSTALTTGGAPAVITAAAPATVAPLATTTPPIATSTPALEPTPVAIATSTPITATATTTPITAAIPTATTTPAP